MAKLGKVPDTDLAIQLGIHRRRVSLEARKQHQPARVERQKKPLIQIDQRLFSKWRIEDTSRTFCGCSGKLEACRDQPCFNVFHDNRVDWNVYRKSVRDSDLPESSDTNFPLVANVLPQLSCRALWACPLISPLNHFMAT